jgi:Domain of unknown function (DUF4124)
MITRLLCMSVPAMLAGTIGLQPALADVYTWVDKSGSVNVSNLAPPEGAHVTNVVHAIPAEIAAREAAAREAARQSEVQALAERVRQLEGEVQLASRPPPPMQYQPVPAPPLMQYSSYPTMPPAAPYAPYAAPQANYGCDFSGIDCGSWGLPGFYPASIIVLRVPNFRRPQPIRDGHHFAVQLPSRSPGTFHRG